MVEYKDIPNFPGYRAGTDGTIWSCKKRGLSNKSDILWKQLKGKIGNGGYPEFLLRKDGKKLYSHGHRLVLETFIGPCHTGMICRHFPDQNPLNFSLDNIQWGTRSENEKDKKFTGKDNRGERNIRTKLSEKDVLEIRKLLKDKKCSCSELGRKYGVNKNQIYLIRDNKSWTHAQEVQE